MHTKTDNHIFDNFLKFTFYIIKIIIGFTEVILGDFMAAYTQ